jgi:hypothetical protein
VTLGLKFLTCFLEKDCWRVDMNSKVFENNKMDTFDSSPINMQRQRRSTAPPQAGDIFAIKPLDLPFLFGRVIRTDSMIGGFSNVILIYIYKMRSHDKYAIPQLNRSDLLVAPIGTNQRPWSEGFFETVQRKPLDQSDVLSQHCFFDAMRTKPPFYLDEMGAPLLHEFEPCGTFGLTGYYYIDVLISEALGIEIAPRPNDPIG